MMPVISPFGDYDAGHYEDDDPGAWTKDDVCPVCKCGAEPRLPHPCPWQVEVNGQGPPCNCCQQCMRRCLEDT